MTPPEMSRPTLLFLLALCAGNMATSPENRSEGDFEEPPRVFPTDKAQPFNSDKLRPTNLSSEAVDMNKNVSVMANATYEVDHPKVKNPGTTHEEKRGEGRGTIQACSFPDPGSASSASDWLADSGHVSKLANLCKLPSDLLNSTTGMLRICSIPKDVWDSAGNNFTSGTVPMELLAKLNAPNVSCVTPRSNSSANENDTIVTGSIPSAWLLGNNDTIYIYIIPREWLNKTKTASEVEDLTREPALEKATPTAPIDVNATTSTDTSHFKESTTQTESNQSSPHADPTDSSSQFITKRPETNADNSTENSQNATYPSTNANTIFVSTRAPPAIEIKSNTTSMQNVSTTVSPSSLQNATEYSSVVQRTKDNFKPTDRPKKYITTKPFEKSTLSRKFSNKSETLSSTPQTAIPTQKVTYVPNITTTSTEKSDELSTLGHSDSENEIHHSAPKSALLSQSHSDQNLGSSSGKTGFLQPTESAAILAGVFVAIALLGYAGLLLWRRVLEKRYGNREMLVNEDDDFDTSDMRHFEL